MDKLAEAMKARAICASSAKQIVDSASQSSRDLTDDETAKIEQLLAEASSYDEKIERLQKEEEIKEKTETIFAKSTAASHRKTDSKEAVFGRTPSIYSSYSNSIKSFSNFSPSEKVDRAYVSAQFIRALCGHDDAIHWCQKHAISNAMTTSSNTGGGYLVPEELWGEISNIRDTFGLARKVCKKIPMSSDVTVVPIVKGHVSTYFVGEGVEATESQMSFGTARLVAKKVMALTKISSELTADSAMSIVDMIINDIGVSFADKEDGCLFAGDGTQTYGGIKGLKEYMIGLAGAVAAASGHNTMAEIDAVDLTKLMGALPEYARTEKCAWYCSSTFADMVFTRLAATAGGNNMMTLQNNIVQQFLGYPVYRTTHLPSSTGDLASKVMCLFGNLEQAVYMGDRRGVETMQLRERWAELDLVGIMSSERFDLVYNNIGDASTVGSVVALVGTA